jgi:hypothetical protein
MTLRSKKFQTHSELTKFVNDGGINAASVQQIVAEAASGGYTLFWWA